MAVNTMEDLPPGYETRVVALPTPPDQRVTRLDLAQLIASPPPAHQWVWDGYIERGTMTVLHGDGATGKSILAGHLCRAVTTGGTCLGRPTTQGNCLIIDAENPLDEIHRRVHALDYATAPPDTIHYYRAQDTILGAGTTPDVELLAELVQRHHAHIVILDSQRGLWAGEEKEALDIRRFYRQLQNLAEALDCAVILIHHDRRTGDFSGSSDIHNSADTRLWLERPDRDKPERILHHAKARSSAELQPAAYTFTYDQQLGLFTFTQPRHPITEADTVFDALDIDEWRIYTEVADRAGMRQADVKAVLWELCRAGDAQSMTGPPGRSKRAVGFRKLRHQRNPSQTRDGSGRVAEIVPSANPSPAFTPPLGGEDGTGRHAEPVPSPDELPPTTHDDPFTLPDDDIPF